MGYILQNTTSLQLVDKDGEFIELDDFQEVGEHEVISKPSFKEDDETRQATFQADLDGNTITARVQYTSGMSGLEVQNVDVEGVPEEYQEESSVDFEFQECEDDE
ncbi:hypothetical protein VOA_001446 [Vibrio sp. RC586]|uniref:hypothetical protein n=1 Tax=Vibrio sp. RC586 TaxID=675815 RepID=UPI0001BB853A|nr:hypothetical protein [Vibrio sp. RC586]EEY99097.1 hypothetical protein VOA_001446 [Vibrio sp. RC586]